MSVGGFGQLSGPLVALLTVGVLLLLLRWAFARGKSLVEPRPRPGHADEYGLLVSVASPATYVEGELLRRRLLDAGLRATLAQTSDGPRLMVFARDEAAARRVLAR